MASTHKHIRSSTADKRPTTAIADGQIALNTNATSPGLFFKDSTGADIIKVGPVHVGATAPNVSPAAGGSSGNSTGEVWLDNSLTPVGVKIWDGSAWVNATPAGSTTVQGLLELATDAETQTGSDTARAVTPASLQSKVSDSTSTTSSTTIASSTAVKSAYDLANAALPLSGGIVTGNLEIGNTGSLSFEGSTADAFETTIAVTDPTADRTITLPDVTGTVVTTGDTGTVTSTMLLDGTIVDGDINASAAIAHSKLANITAGSVLLGNATNVPTATALSGDVTVNSSGVTAISSGVIVDADINASAAIADTKLDTISTADKVSLSALNIDGGTDIGGALADADLFIVDDGGAGTNRKAAATRITDYAFGKVSGDITIGSTGTAAISSGVIVNADVNASAAIAGTKISPDFGSQTVATTGLVSTGTGTAGAPTITFTGDTNTGIYSPGADQVAISTNGVARLTASTTAVSSTLAIDHPLGAVGTPSITFTGDLNTGFWSPTADTIAASTGSSERLRIDSSGRLGLGTSSPGFLLDCKETGAISVARFLTGSTSSSEVAQFGRSDQAVNLSIDYDGAGSMGIGTTTAHPFNLKTGAVTRATIDTSGRLGIGTTSPSQLIHGSSSGAATLFLQNTSGNNTGITLQNDGQGTASLTYNRSANTLALAGPNADITFANASQAIVFTTSGEAARIDSSKRLLVGTSTARQVGGTDSALVQIEGEENDPALSACRFSGSGAIVGVAAPALTLGKARGTKASPTIVSNNDVLGYLFFSGYDGSDFSSYGAGIKAEVDGTPGADDMPGRLVFSTTADGASSPTERMRISQSGDVFLRQAGGSERVYFTGAGAASIGPASYAASSTTLYIGNAAIQVSSDVRLKDNIEDTALDALDAISKIKVKDFTWNDPSDTSFNNRNARGKWTGLIAQELVEVLPFVVNAPRKEEDGSIDYESEERWLLDQSQLCPVLIKAIQQQQETIAGLEARIAALEAS